MFKIRTTKPEAGNKNYIRKANGGWNTCVQGNPTDADCNVLSNCVGYASGRFNEIYNELTGYEGHKWNTLNCNAENFIERAQQAGLQISDKPALGAILCWRKGKAGVSEDGAGHVAIVERIYDDNTIYTSESCYGGAAFYNKTRSNDNNNWGMNSPYAFRGFIINPAVGKSILTPIDRDTTKDQINIKISCLRIRKEPNTSSDWYGFASKGYYNVLEKTDSTDYTWYKLAENMWVAGVEDVDYLPANKEVDLIKVKELLEECLNLLS